MDLADKLLSNGRGAVRDNKPVGRTINIALSPELKVMIQDEAMARGMNVSQLVKTALAAYLKANPKPGQVAQVAQAADELPD